MSALQFQAPIHARILVASDNVDDATLVRGLLCEEFAPVELTTDASSHVQDVERFAPQVVVLAFDSIDKADRWSADFGRDSDRVQAVSHRTVLLCSRDELARAYALCRDQRFDDYVLFWPMNHDAPRLPMAVHHALRVTSLLPKSGGSALGGARTPSPPPAAAMHDAAERLAAARRALASGKPVSPSQSPSQPPPTHAPARVPTNEQTREAVIATTARHRRTRILVVDDDALQRRLLTHALDAAQIDVQAVASGAEALLALERTTPDLIFMDFKLPDIDGVEVTRRVRASAAGVPIVMLTGYSDRQLVRDSLGAGAAGFLVKPVTRETLYAQVNALLGTGTAIAASVRPG